MKRIVKFICWGGLAFLAVACSSFSTGVQKVGSLDTGTAYRVVVQNGFAYVAINDGVAVVDVSSPEHPKRTALIELEGAAFGVYAQGDLLFIAGPIDGLVIADIQEPSDPQVIGIFATSGINEVCANGEFVYAATQQGELQILSVKDPEHPLLLNTYQPRGGWGLMVACSRDVVYFSSSDKGLDVLDVSDPTKPVKVATVVRTEGAKDAQFVGDLMYLSCHGNGVRILDLHDPLAPKTIASFKEGGEAWGVGGDADFLWIGDLQEGIKVYDMSDPKHPALLVEDSRYAPHDIFFDGEFAYLADQDRGLVILDYFEMESEE